MQHLILRIENRMNKNQGNMDTDPDNGTGEAEDKYKAQ